MAALGGLLIAWAATRSYDDSTPGPAVRLYSSLFRSTGVAKLRDAADSRKRFPKREAFLATWFLTFFAIFVFGVTVWPCEAQMAACAPLSSTVRRQVDVVAKLQVHQQHAST
jgi:hypothetical protein